MNTHTPLPLVNQATEYYSVNNLNVLNAVYSTEQTLSNDSQLADAIADNRKTTRLNSLANLLLVTIAAKASHLICCD